MQITFNLQHVLNPGSSLDVNTDALRTLRGCLTRLNRARPHNGIAPALYRIDGHCVVWDIPFAFYDGASDEVNAGCLRALLDCLIDFNIMLLKRLPDVTPLYQSPVFYKRTQVWDAIPALYNKGFGDCKSLTAALIAEYRMRGVQCIPEFRFDPPKVPGGTMLFHILVRTLTGNEDPSKIKGMGNEYQRMIY
jgi:hypothetical protein